MRKTNLEFYQNIVKFELIQTVPSLMEIFDWRRHSRMDSFSNLTIVQVYYSKL